MSEHSFQKLAAALSYLIVFAPALLLAADPIPELAAPADVVFKARLDGSEQRYVIRLPKEFDSRRSHRLLVALHGHGSDRWQFANDPRGECKAARDVAAKYQMIYVCPDYRAKTSWMGPSADADLRQILDDLHLQFRIDSIVICGGSMGGTSALAFATMHPELVDGVVSMNGTANLVEYAGFAQAIAESFGGTKSEKPDEYRRRSAELFPERLTFPVGLTTGGRDTVVPAASTQRLFQLLKQRQFPVHLISRAEGGHETTYEDAVDALQFVIEKNASATSLPAALINFDQRPRTIVCLGDSVTGVYYHTGGRRAYPEMLELGLKELFPRSAIEVVNAGISGQTTADGLARLERDVLGKHPDLVTISFGLNDVTRIAPEDFRENLVSLVQRCRDKNSQVLLCTPNAVIDTVSRPIEKIVAYCEIIRAVGREMSVPVCDQYQAGFRLRNRAPWTWRLALSDEIHPNMDGHKRMAEELCRSIASDTVSLESVGPPAPLEHTLSVLKQKRILRVLAMSPYDAQIEAVLKRFDEQAKVEVTTWKVAGKTILDLEQEAKNLARPFKPDLVVLAVPRAAAAETDEQFVHGYSWIMNWSLSFGHQEWDCVVVHPSVAAADVTGQRDELCRRLVTAQHLHLIDRTSGDLSTAEKVFAESFSRLLAP